MPREWEALADADKFVKSEVHLATPLMTKTPKRSGDLADGETGEGERTPPTSGEGVANALDRWDEEGGTPELTQELWRVPDRRL